MKSVMVLGGMGNMGRRYCAVLRHLGLTPVPVDVADGSIAKLERSMSGVQGIIIATPTASHVSDITQLAPFGVPILCEKPIATSLAKARAAVGVAKFTDTPLAMVNQYKMLTNPNDDGPSFYDYWNHGRDGLSWDCISIIALAKGPVALGEDSPIWNCMINGLRLSPSMMDEAYIEMIAEWAENPISRSDYIESAHQKVEEYERKNERSTEANKDPHRHSGPEHQQSPAEQGNGNHRRHDNDAACSGSCAGKCQLHRKKPEIAY